MYDLRDMIEKVYSAHELEHSLADEQSAESAAPLGWILPVTGIAGQQQRSPSHYHRGPNLHC